VLLDINLPYINGFEVCRRLKNDPATVDIPVVFLTAIDRYGNDKPMAENVGASALLFYPIEADQLSAVIQGQIAQSQES
jgi:CheY-like chemotaxis protein